MATLKGLDAREAHRVFPVIPKGTPGYTAGARTAADGAHCAPCSREKLAATRPSPVLSASSFIIKQDGYA